MVTMMKKTPVERIYKAFYESRKKMLYFNQIKDISGLSDSSLWLALKKLKKERQIDVTKEKANTFYKLKNKNKTKIYFTSLDYEQLETLNTDIKIPLKKFLREKPEETAFIILFGSASRKQETKGSDIDLLIVLHSFENADTQKVYKKEVKGKLEKLRQKINASSIYPLSIFYTGTKDFVTSKDRVVQEAKATGFCIDGNMLYYDTVADYE